MFECISHNLSERTKNILKKIVAENSPTVFSSSIAVEDMVLTDMILRNNLQIDIFTLDTGFLHKETLDMLHRIKIIYGDSITLFQSEQFAVAKYVKNYGLQGFYDSVDLRKKCCRIRKIELLNRALIGYQP